MVSLARVLRAQLHQWNRYFPKLSSFLGPEQAKLELRWMVESLQKSHCGNVAKAQAQELASMVARRVSGEPLQYILGTQPFGMLNLLTRPPVLIPRPETEDWTLRLSQFIRPSPEKPVKLLDLCTGSGCIPLLLCRLWPAGSVQAFGVDISDVAVRLSLDNARLCDIRVSSEASPTPTVQNMFLPILADIRNPEFVNKSGLHPPFDVITSNPPYIPKHEFDALPYSVKNFEDVRALLGDPDPDGPGSGLTFYYTIAKLIVNNNMLAKDGILAVEVGQGQAKDVESILREEGGLHSTMIWKDPWEVERVVLASKRFHRLASD